MIGEKFEKIQEELGLNVGFVSLFGDGTRAIYTTFNDRKYQLITVKDFTITYFEEVDDIDQAIKRHEEICDEIKTDPDKYFNSAKRNFT